MARANGISPTSYSTLFLVFLLLISNAECRTNPSALAAAGTTTLTCNQVYGAQLDDTCTTIAQNFGLTAESFSGINPNLNCDKIFVGQWLCLSGKIST